MYTCRVSCLPLTTFRKTCHSETWVNPGKKCLVFCDSLTIWLLGIHSGETRVYMLSVLPLIRSWCHELICVPECSNDAFTSKCSIPIHDRLVGIGSHFQKYNAWSVNDTYLDWHGAEQGQGTYQGQAASGTPAIWTTNDASKDGYIEFNQ